MKLLIPNIVLFLLTCCSHSGKTITIEPIIHRYEFNNEIEENLNASTELWKFQFAAWNYSYIGEYKKALSVWDAQFDSDTGTYNSVDDSLLGSYKQVDAIKYIVSQLDSTQVVILNESHHNPLHRVFATELLSKAYMKGFRYLGVEDLDYSDTELNNRKYPIRLSGRHSIEPQFGNFIREALRIGYTLFPYDSKESGSGKDREINQAKNIQKQILKDGESKYLIYCGYDHVVEGEYGSWEKAMAGRLKELTGINPLTINQTDYTEKSKKELEEKIYRELDIKTSSVLVDSNNESFKYSENPDWFDLMIFHPRTVSVDNRPNWVFKNGKEKFRLRLNNIAVKKPYLIMAFKASENYRNSIPFDILEVKDNLKYVTLSLEKGNYNLVFQNRMGQSELMEIEVE